jgi:hypothetical protein
MPFGALATLPNSNSTPLIQMKIVTEILKAETPSLKAFRDRHAQIEKRTELFSEVIKRRDALFAAVDETRQAFFESSTLKDFENHVAAEVAFKAFDAALNQNMQSATTINRTVSNDEAQPIMLAAFKDIGDRIQAKVIALVSEEKARLKEHGIATEEYAEPGYVTALRAELSRFREYQNKVSSCQPNSCIELWTQLHGHLIAR